MKFEFQNFVLKIFHETGEIFVFQLVLSVFSKEVYHQACIDCVAALQTLQIYITVSTSTTFHPLSINRLELLLVAHTCSSSMYWIWIASGVICLSVKRFRFSLVSVPCRPLHAWLKTFSICTKGTRGTIKISIFIIQGETFTRKRIQGGFA